MIIIKATKINKESFYVKVDINNWQIIRNLLEKEKHLIIDKLLTYKAAGFIGSIFRPRNKVLQKELDILVKKKRLLQNSINQIYKIFR